MYELVIQHAQTWGLVLLSSVFAIAVIYALWPGNRDKFNAAAREPLREDEDDV